MTFNTDPAKETAHTDVLGAVTPHTLAPPLFMATPDKVMRIPALAAPLVRAWMGVNVNEAVVTAAFTAEVSVIWRAPICPPCADDASNANSANVKKKIEDFISFQFVLSLPDRMACCARWLVIMMTVLFAFGENLQHVAASAHELG